MDELPARIRALIEHFAPGDRSPVLALHALITAADDSGTATFNDVAIRYREDHLLLFRATGRDVEREAGRLSLDEVRTYLEHSVFPRLVADGVVILPPGGLTDPNARIRLVENF